jgi:hypothetical protein
MERVIISIKANEAYSAEKDDIFIQVSIRSAVLGEKIITLAGFDQEIKDEKIVSVILRKYCPESNGIILLKEFIDSWIDEQIMGEICGENRYVKK